MNFTESHVTKTERRGRLNGLFGIFTDFLSQQNKYNGPASLMDVNIA